MSSKDVLKKYHNRLIAEGWIKSAICALNAGLAVCIIVAVSSYFAGYKGLLLSILLGAGVLCVSAPVFYFTLFRPSFKKTAERLDATGLEESAVTMVDYAENPSFMAEKQRTAAAEKISKVKPGRIGPRFFKIPIAAMAVLIAVAVSVLMIPPRMEKPLAVPPANEEDKINDIIIDQMLDDLRDAIDNATISDKLRDELHSMVDELEKNLENCETIEEKIELIKETGDKILEIIASAQTAKEFGEALQEYENTEELGKALVDGGASAIDEAIENIREQLHSFSAAVVLALKARTGDAVEQPSVNEELKAAIDSLYASVTGALEKCGEEDELRKIFSIFAEDLKDASSDAANMAEKADAALDKLKDALIEEMQNQSGAGELGEEIKDIIDNTLDELGDKSEEEPGEDEEEDKGDEGEEPAEPDEGDGEEEENPGEGGEVIDKVIDGTIPYLDVFDEYFKKAMEEAENGELSEEMKEIIRRYFDMLA